MSMKTRYLLHRSGRNQFGDPGEGPLPPYEPSPEVTAQDDRLRARHVELNNAFVSKYGDAWLATFTGLSQKDTWTKLYPYARPALSTFRAHAREFASFQEFLLFLLLSNKRSSLALLGYSKAAISEALSGFAECGRYYVSYGKSQRTFGTL